MDRVEIDRRFDYHAPTDEKISYHEAIRNASKALAGIVNAVAPEGREKSLAFTALEEATFWANAAVARND